MKTKLSLVGLALLVFGQLAVAQTNEPADDWKPSVSNQQGKQYPQVNSEGRVRARIVAPQAQSVALEFLGGTKYPLTKGDDGASAEYFMRSVGMPCALFSRVIGAK